MTKSDDQNPRSGGYALMLPIANTAPGWDAVCLQAEECGMRPKPPDDRHLTLTFFGRDLSEAKSDKIVSATQTVMSAMGRAWKQHQLAQAGIEHRGGCSALDNYACDCGCHERIEAFVFAPAFVPVRFTGEIVTFENRTASHVVALVEPAAGIRQFRKDVIDGLDFRVREDFGGWKPHVTLAEGPPGTRLRREAGTPRCSTSARSVLLKLGKERQVHVFG